MALLVYCVYVIGLTNDGGDDFGGRGVALMRVRGRGGQIQENPMVTRGAGGRLGGLAQVRLALRATRVASNLIR